MDTVTHALTGAVIGYCGFRQRGGKLALWTTIAAAEFPDADIVMGSFGDDAILRWHRSFTHSVVMLPFWVTFVAAVFWAFSKRSDYRLLWLASLAGIASHLFLDWITSYGTMLLWPVSNGRYELSWVFILDPYVWAMSGVALWAAIRSQREHVAQAGLAVVAGYFLMCGVLHWFAVPPDGAAYAQPLNPFRWTIVRAEGDRLHWSDGRRNDTFTQFHDDVLWPKAEATEAVKMYRWFAAFPLVEKINEKGRTMLRYRDLRFRSPMPWGKVSEGMFVVAVVVFDDQSNVVASALGSVDDNRH